MLFLVALILIGSVSIVSAQTSWWRTYGGTYGDGGLSVQQTLDGGYVIAGFTNSFGAGNGDVYLIKTTPSGYTLWTRAYGGTKIDLGYSAQQTSDGGYIVACITLDRVCGVSLIKTDAQGDTLWTRTCGSTTPYDGCSVRQTSDGGYIFAAGSNYDGDVYLIKTNASGEILWTRTYGGTRPDWGFSVQQTADTGYIITGTTLSFGAGIYDVYLIKTNAAGDTLWTRTYGGTEYDIGHSVQQTADGGYIIAGQTGSFGAGNGDVYLIKTDASGDTMWTRTWGGTNDDLGYSVQQTADGGYIIAGSTYSFGAGAPDSANVYLIKTDANGDTSWTKTWGGTNRDEGYSVQQTADGGYIVAGFTASFGAGDDDVYLIKSDSLGNVGVAEEDPKPQVMRDRLGTTVLSGASGVRQFASCVAFDAMGRRVLHPKPGIYFLRTAATAAPQKVLLVR
jgi:hypothetical protein